MKPVRRVLIVQPYGIGDLLFVTPVLRALRLLPSIERVDILLGSRTEAVVRSNPHVDQITPIDKDLFHRRSRRANLSDVLKLGASLRSKKYDLLLDYSLRSEFGFFGKFFLGIPRRAGFKYKRRALFHNIRVDLSEGYKDRHVADYCASLAEAAGIPVRDRFLEFYFTDKERQDAASAIARKSGKRFETFMVLCPGGGASWGKDAHFKQWPVREFAALAEKIRSDFPADGVYVLGSEGESGLADELCSLLKLPHENLSGKLTLTETAWLTEQSRLFLGNDGGLMHLAHALRVPVLAMYGPVAPEVYGPYPKDGSAMAFVKKDLECRPCYRKFRYKSDCAHLDCLQSLTSNEVYTQIKAAGFFGKNLKHTV